MPDKTKDIHQSHNVIFQSQEDNSADALSFGSKVTKGYSRPNVKNTVQGVAFNLKSIQFSSTVLYSLLALAVAGCGGGGGPISEGLGGSGSNTSGSGSGSNTSGSGSGSLIKTGRVIKGPLENALVGLDYNGDGVIDTNTVTTDRNGYFSITANATDFKIIVQTTLATIDHSAGTVLPGIILSAPSGSDVVTLPTHIMVEGQLNSSQVTKVLGLDENIDLLKFDPFAEGVDEVVALDFEKTGQQLIAVVTAFANAAEGSGATEADAYQAALDSLVDVISSKTSKLTDANATEEEKILDLTSTTDLGLLKDVFADNVSSDTNVDMTVLNAVIEDTVSATKNVNDKIATVSELDSDATKGTFSLTNVLADQVKSAAENESDIAGSGSIDFTNSVNVDLAALNKAPTELLLSSNSIVENASSLSIGQLTTVDSDQPDGVLHSYKIAQIAGTDYQAFTIDPETGELSLLQNPDFETKSTYNITILSTDVGGKTFSNSFVINVTDVNEVPILSTPIADHDLLEDSLLSFQIREDTFVDFDVNDTLTYIATLINGDALPNWLNFNSTTLTFSGTPLNDDVGSIDVKVTATDSSGLTASDTFTITVQNVNDAPVFSASTVTTGVAEFEAVQNVVYTPTASDEDHTTLTYSLGGADASYFTIDSSTGAVKLKAAPVYGTKASYDFSITVSDGQAADTQDVRLNVLDTTAPNAPVITTSSGNLTDPTPTITGTAEANSTVYLYSGETLLGQAMADSSGNWSVTTSALADATYSVSAKSVDASGNTSAASNLVNLTIDYGELYFEPAMGIAYQIDAPSEINTGDLIVTNSVVGLSITGILNYELNGSEQLKYSVDAGANWLAVNDTDPDLYKFAFAPVGIGTGSSELEIAIFDGNLHGQIARQSIFVEESPAAISLSGAHFNFINNALSITGAGIESLLLPNEGSSTDIKSRLDWTKLSWDVAGSTITFTSNDIETVRVTDTSCLQINFSLDGVSKLAAAAVDAGDALNIASGFLQQASGADITAATLTDCKIRVFSSASGKSGAFDLFDQFVIDFGEDIQRGSGTIHLRDPSGTIIESFDAATSSLIVVTGTSAVVKPTWKLQGSTGYYLTYSDGAFQNASGQALSGVSHPSILSFETDFENQNVLGFSPMRTEYPGDTVETLGMHTVLYVPLSFADLPTSPYATYNFKSPAFNTNFTNLIRENTLNDTNDFYISTSQGAMTFNGVMSQPFVVPIAYSMQQSLGQTGVGDLSYPMLLAKDAATRAGYSTDNNVVVSHWNMAVKGPVAVGGGNNVWLVPLVSDSAVLAHEAGHALDLGHASASFWGGYIVEYGNVLDNMGTAEAINGDFGAVIKYQRLGWIEPEAYLLNPGSGVYRLSPMDQENRFVGDYYGMSQGITSDELGDSPSFSLEYRTTLTYDYWGNDLSPLKDQVLVLRNNVLIDRINEGKQTQSDAGIFVGETWQIPGSNTYFSVLGKGANSEYLDVVYMEGTFPDNIAPTSQVAASRTNVAAGDSVTFTTNAFDDNGDGLLYFWRFSDDVRGYGASYTRTFSQTSPTDITGTLIVSDMRGGISTHTITVHAGASASDSLVQSVGAMTRVTDATIPTVAINSVNAVSVEGGELGHFVVKRVGVDFGSALTVNLTYDGTATLNTDYTAPTSVTIAAGQSEVSFNITPINDTALEASEYINVAIAADSSYTISNQNTSAKIELRDNDTPVVTVDVLDAQAMEGSDDRAMVVFHRTGPTADPLTIYYGLTGDAYNGGDYNRLDGQITFAAGEATVALPITAIDDEVGEATEQVSIYLTAFGQLYSVGPQNSATVNLLDNNDRPVVNLVNAQATLNEGTTAVLTFEVVGGDGSQLTVHYAVSGSVSAADYETLSGTITLPTGGRQTATLEIDLRNDALVEGYEVLQIDLLESKDYLIGTQNTVQQVIRDANQDYKNGEVIVSPFALISGQSVDESEILGDHVYVDGAITDAKVENNDTALRFYISRAERGGGDDLKVFFALDGTATPGIDYMARVIDGAPKRPIRSGNPTEVIKEFTSLSATNNELIIPSSFNGVIVEIIPVNDTIAEGTETITLRLESAVHVETGDMVPLGLLQSATLHLDDDDISPVKIEFAQSYTVIGENAAADQRVYEIPVELSAASTDTITVGYYISSATAHGRGSDYTFLNAAGDPVSEGTLSFAPGQTTQKIYIAVKPDAIPEGMESLTIALEHPTNASLATPTVSDDLHHRVYIFDTIPDQPALKMVREERWLGKDVYDDNTWDLTASQYQGVLPEFATETGTAINVSRKLIGEITATETGEYTFYLSHAESTADRARVYISSDDSAANKTLLISSQKKVLFEDWENADQATVSLIAGQSYYIEVQQRKSADIALGWKVPGSTEVRTVQTSFNPEATTEPYTVEFVTSEAFYTEGDNAVVYLTLDRPNPNASVTVTIAVDAAVSTASDIDYTLSTQTLTFSPGEITKSINLSLLSDDLAEAPELLVLNIVDATGAKVLGNKQMAVWLTDSLAPDISLPASALSVSRLASDGAVIGSVSATVDTGRSISSWEIVSGNPQLQGSSTSAFVINNAGQITLANGKALPLGDYALRLLIKATDTQGASSHSWLDVNIGAGAAGAQTNQIGFNTQSLGEYTISSSAATNTGSVNRIMSDEVTRDNTLELNGTALDGTLVRVYDGSVLIGETVARTNNTWSLTTPVLTDGAHTFRAEMISPSGNIGVTDEVIFRVHTQTEVMTRNLLTVEASGTANTSSYVVDIKAVSQTGAGAIIYSKGGELYIVDYLTNEVSLITHNGTNTSSISGASVDFSGISRDANKIVFGTNDIEAFGFSDLSTSSQLPYSDLILFDRADSSLTLLTSTTTSASSNSASANFIGFAGEGRYVIYTTESAENIKDFVAQGKDANERSTDIIAYDTLTGESKLLTHSEVVSGKESSISDANDIQISGDGKYVIFSALDVSKLGNNGATFTDASPASKDWLATNIETGEIQLLSHQGTSLITSNGLAMTYLGTTNEQPYAIFNCENIADLGFGDPGTNVADLVAVNLGTGEIKLISHAGTAPSAISANTTVTFEKIVGDYVYFSAGDSSVFGFQDGYINELDLLRYSVSTGAIELMTHTHDSLLQSIKGPAYSYFDTFSMSYTPGSVIASDDGRYVSFAIDVAEISAQYSQIISNSFKFDPGNLTFITDTYSGNIRGLDTEVITGDVFGPGRYADWDTAYFTPDGSAFVWQTTQMRGIATKDGAVFEGNSKSSSGNAVLVLDLTNGVKNAGSIQTSSVLTHGEEGTFQVYAGNDVTLLGVSNDSRFAFVQVKDATNLGNDGVAFIDASPNEADIVAIDLKTQEITLLTGEDKTSFGFDFSIIGSSEAGNIFLGTSDNLTNVKTITGTITDQNNGVDVLTVGGSILTLTDQDTAGTISLVSRVTAGSEFILLDDGVAVDRQVADQDGIINWIDIGLTDVGKHRYSLQDPTFIAPVVGVDDLVADAILITAQYVNDEWFYETNFEIV